MSRSLLLSLLCVQACTSAPSGQLHPLGSATTTVAQPLKVAVLFDGSQSMSVTDPTGARIAALLDLLQSLPQDGSVSVQVGVFTADAVFWQLPTGFQALSTVTAADRQTLAQSVLDFVVPADAPNRDSTSFVSPLNGAYDLISADLDCASTYSVILVSDGSPTTDEDSQLLCGTTLTRFQALGQQSAGVHVNTAFVFEPGQPFTGAGCTYDPGTGCSIIAPTCLQSQVAADAARLERMAGLGNGTFVEFSGSTPVTFTALVPSTPASSNACGP